VAGLGGVRITDYTSRRQEYETYRLVARINPLRRQWRTVALFGVVAIVATGVTEARLGHLSSGHLALYGVLVVICALLASDRMWAWRAAGRFMRMYTAGPWHLGADADGITCAVDGQSSAYDWSAFVHVVEGEAGIVFAFNVSRSGVAWVSLPGEPLSAEDRASIRAWAQAAPGAQRPWTTVSGTATAPADGEVVRSRLGAAASASVGMDGPGGVFVTLARTRDNVCEAYRLVARVQPGRRWSRPVAWLFLLAMSALAVPAVAGGDAAPLARVLLLVGAGTWTCIVMATDRAIASERAWARRRARPWPRSPAGGVPVRMRADGDGLSFAAGGLFRSLDWSGVTQVAEGDSAIVFVTSASLRGVMWWGMSGADLSSEDRARIRSWAEAAPGEREWISFRRRPRSVGPAG